MLMCTKNIEYKGKSLHVHRNNKNHILKNENGNYILPLDPSKSKKSKIKTHKIEGLFFSK
jgi:hypothetical protein